MWEISVPWFKTGKKLVCYVPPCESLVLKFKSLQEDDSIWTLSKPRIRRVNIDRPLVNGNDIALIEA